MELTKLLEQIPDQDTRAMGKARERWAACAKPLGSLGLLETALEEIAGLTGSPVIQLTPRAVLVLCADNGVVDCGVTQTDASVTGIVARNLAAGRTSVCCMARVAGCAVVPVDLGMVDFGEEPGVLSRRVGNGTGNIAVGPAMTRAQAEKAIGIGAALAMEQAQAGVRLLATGEMGIGNTTTSSAVSCALLGKPPSLLTGRGAGLSDAGFRRKRQAVERALAVNRPDPHDPVDVLAKVGGFDIAGLCGVFLGAAAAHVPVLIDGFISAVAALCALRLCPRAGHAMLAAHCSAEPGGQLLLEALGKRPFLTAGMRLGEGTGAVAAMPVLDMALAVYENSYTFADGGIQAYEPQGGEEC